MESKRSSNTSIQIADCDADRVDDREQQTPPLSKQRPPECDARRYRPPGRRGSDMPGNEVKRSQHTPELVRRFLFCIEHLGYSAHSAFWTVQLACQARDLGKCSCRLFFPGIRNAAVPSRGQCLDVAESLTGMSRALRPAPPVMQRNTRISDHKNYELK